jgi:hypothetical protein
MLMTMVAVWYEAEGTVYSRRFLRGACRRWCQGYVMALVLEKEDSSEGMDGRLRRVPYWAYGKEMDRDFMRGHWMMLRRR